MNAILVVDDDPAMRKMLGAMLTRRGYQVLESANGNEALAQINSVPISLVITDIIMPEKEGLETIQEIRRRWPAVKILAISGGGRIDSKDCLKAAKLLGATRTLEKPFTTDELALSMAECALTA